MNFSNDLLGIVKTGNNPEALHLDSLISISQYNILYDLTTKFIPKGKKVLDWGAGNGHFSYFLCQKGYKTTGFSMEKFMFKKWVNKFPYKFIKGKISEPKKLPFKNSSFDAILSVGVLEHVREIRGNEVDSLKEIYRVLKPKGIFLCYHLPNKYSLIEYVGRIFTKKFSHIYLFTQTDIKKMASDSGIRIISTGQYGILPRNFSHKLHPVIKYSKFFAAVYDTADYLLSKALKPFCQNHFFIAKKV